MNFKDYAKHSKGTYVSMPLSYASKNALHNFITNELKLTETVDPSTLHITIIYSRTPVPTADKLEGFPTIEQAEILGYEVFPTKNDGYCIVLRLKYRFAELMNKVLTDEGATSDYAEYKPHVTIAYDIKETIDINTLPIPTFKLSFDSVRVEPLNEEYNPNVPN
jgi:2'-5' RNA ligase